MATTVIDGALAAGQSPVKAVKGAYQAGVFDYDDVSTLHLGVLFGWSPRFFARFAEHARSATARSSFS